MELGPSVSALRQRALTWLLGKRGILVEMSHDLAFDCLPIWVPRKFANIRRQLRSSWRGCCISDQPKIDFDLHVSILTRFVDRVKLAASCGTWRRVT